MTAAPIERDSHLSPTAYRAQAVLAACIGLAASYVTVRLFALAIEATEQAGAARDLLILAAVLFVAAELAACFIAGLVPVQRLRALRWQLIVCAVFLVGFEAVSIYGARIMLVNAADAQADARRVRVEQLRARIEANRRSAAALVEAGQRSSQSVIASSRADGAQAIRDAAAMEAGTARLSAELAQLEAERTPTASVVFGQSGVIALAVVQSMLISIIGLVFLGTAGALARAARDAQGSAAPMHRTALTDAKTVQADAVTYAPFAVRQSQVTPRGAVPAVPGWGRTALAAGAGLMTLTPAYSVAAPMQATAAPTALAEPMQPEADAAPVQADAVTDAAPAVADAPAMHCTDAPMQPTASTDAPAAAAPMQADAVVADAPLHPTDDEARYQRVRAGIEAGQIKPTLRAIYAASGASQEVARRYLVELDQAGVIERAGRGYALRATATQGELV